MVEVGVEVAALWRRGEATPCRGRAGRGGAGEGAAGGGGGWRRRRRAAVDGRGGTAAATAAALCCSNGLQAEAIAAAFK